MNTNADKIKDSQEVYLEAHKDSVALIEILRDQLDKIDSGLFGMPWPDGETTEVSWRDSSRACQIKTHLSFAYSQLKEAFKLVGEIES